MFRLERSGIVAVLAKHVNKNLSEWQVAPGLEDRVKEAFEGASVADVARKTGRNYHTLRNHLKARRGVPVDLLIQFAAMTNCTLDWLATGEGPIYRTGTGKLGAFALDAQTKTEIRRQIIEVLGALALSGKDRGFDDSLLKEIGDRMREGITDAAP